MLTKAEARSQVRQWIRDPEGKAWADSALDVLFSGVYDELWSELLEAAPWASSQLDTLTSLTSPGYIDLRTLSNGGDLSKRFNKVQKVTRNGVEFSTIDLRHVVIEGSELIVGQDNKYAFLGDQLYLFPLSTTDDVEFRYSYLPSSFITTNESQYLAWPEGFEQVLTLGVAGRIKLADGNEGLLALHAKGFQRLKAHMARRYSGPETIFIGDDVFSGVAE